MAVCQLQREAEDHEQHDAGDRDRRVLPVHVGLRAFLDRAGDLLHAGVTGRVLQHPAHRDDAVDHGEGRGAERKPQRISSDSFRYLPNTNPMWPRARLRRGPRDLRIKPSEAAAAQTGRRRMRTGFKPLFF